MANEKILPLNTTGDSSGKEKRFSFPLETGKGKALSAALYEVEEDTSPPPVKGEGYLPGVCGDIQHYGMRISNYPSLALAQIPAIALVGTLIGGQIAGPSGTDGVSTHLYVVGVGETGVGKQIIFKTMKSLLRTSTMLAQFIGPSGFRSGSAMADYVIENRKKICGMDEFGEILASINNKKDSNQSSQALTLKTLWGIGYGESFENAEGKVDHAGSVPSPMLSIVGATVNELFYEACTWNRVTDGLLNRLLIVKESARSRWVDVEEGVKVPKGLVDQMEELAGRRLHFALREDGKAHAKLAWGEGARDVFMAMEEKKFKEDNPLRASLYQRVPEMTIRLATIFSAAEFGKVVTRENMEIARGIVEASWKEMCVGIRDNAIPEQLNYGQMVFKVLRFIKTEFANTGAPVSKSRITQEFNPKGGRAGDVNAALNALGESEDISWEFGESTGGRRPVLFTPKKVE